MKILENNDMNLPRPTSSGFRYHNFSESPKSYLQIKTIIISVFKSWCMQRKYFSWFFSFKQVWCCDVCDNAMWHLKSPEDVSPGFCKDVLYLLIRSTHLIQWSHTHIIFGILKFYGEGLGEGMSEETLGRYNTSNNDDDGRTQKHYCTLCF